MSERTNETNTKMPWVPNIYPANIKPLVDSLTKDIMPGPALMFGGSIPVMASTTSPLQVQLLEAMRGYHESSNEERPHYAAVMVGPHDGRYWAVTVNIAGALGMYLLSRGEPSEAMLDYAELAYTLQWTPLNEEAVSDVKAWIDRCDHVTAGAAYQDAPSWLRPHLWSAIHNNTLMRTDGSAVSQMVLLGLHPDHAEELAQLLAVMHDTIEEIKKGGDNGDGSDSNEGEPIQA